MAFRPTGRDHCLVSSEQLYRQSACRAPAGRVYCRPITCHSPAATWELGGETRRKQESRNCQHVGHSHGSPPLSNYQCMLKPLFRKYPLQSCCRLYCYQTTILHLWPPLLYPPGCVEAGSGLCLSGCGCRLSSAQVNALVPPPAQPGVPKLTTTTRPGGRTLPQ